MTCKTCKYIFIPKYRISKNRPALYCSRKCFHKSFLGKNNPKWKNKIEYRGIHNWIERELGKPNKCIFCGIIAYRHKIHWSNKSGKYKRDIADWQRLCARCHVNYDLNKKLCLQ